METIKIDDTYDDCSDKEWEVEKIIKERTKLKKNKRTGKIEPIKEYLVRWIGYNYPTWEPESNLENCQEILQDFLREEAIKKLKKYKKKSKSQIPNSLNHKKYKRKKLGNSVQFGAEEMSTFSNSNNNGHIGKINHKRKHSDNLNNNVIEYGNNIHKNEKAPPILRNSKITTSSLDIELDEDNKKSISRPQNENENNIINNENIGINNDRNNVNNFYSNDDKKDDDLDYLITLDEFAHCSYFEDNLNKNLKIKPEKIIKKEREEVFNSNFINKKRKKLKKEKNFEDKKNKNKIEIMEIYSVQIPKISNENYKINAKYKQNNKIYINEFESTSNDIPKDYLIKYYEEILFKFKNGEKISHVLTFKN